MKPNDSVNKEITRIYIYTLHRINLSDELIRGNSQPERLQSSRVYLSADKGRLVAKSILALAQIKFDGYRIISHFDPEASMVYTSF